MSVELISVLIAVLAIGSSAVRANPDQQSRTAEDMARMETRLREDMKQLVHCPESSRRYFGRLFADSFVALPRNTPGIAASRASLTTKIHPELTTRTSRTVH